jgi:hypothetical protein
MPGSGRNGRAKKFGDIEELAREHAPAAIDALLRALVDSKDSVAAAALLLAYAFGRPKQLVEHSGELRQSYVVCAPSPVESAEEWIRRHAPEGIETA